MSFMLIYLIYKVSFLRIFAFVLNIPCTMAFKGVHMWLQASPQLEMGSSRLHTGRHMLPVAMVALLDKNS